jgi:truncated hemoglobin YjbI
MTEHTEPERWKSGNEFLPFHRQASHIDPSYRDGWNACFAEAQKAIDEAVKAERKRCARIVRYQGTRETNTAQYGVDGFWPDQIAHRWAKKIQRIKSE